MCVLCPFRVGAVLGRLDHALVVDLDGDCCDRIADLSKELENDQFMLFTSTFSHAIISFNSSAENGGELCFLIIIFGGETRKQIGQHAIGIVL
jgi:hypothetical protein